MVSHILPSKIRQLVDTTRSLLILYDEQGLIRYLRGRWPSESLIELLGHDSSDVIKVAATCLSVAPDSRATARLLAALGHEDASVSTFAEFAIWTTWFQEFGTQSARQLRIAARAPFSHAKETLDSLIQSHPDWSEPLNQRAIICYRNRYFISAIEDAKAALDINPHHFGALAGLGHAYASLGLYSAAEESYVRALQIHPRMDGIRQSLRMIRTQTREQICSQ